MRPLNQKLTSNTGADGLLIDELSLSERQDNDAYNFFNILKKNAAYHPPQTSTVNCPVIQATQSVKLAKKSTQTQQLTKRSHTNSNQTTIMEGFKTQAMKKPRVNNALQLRVPPLLPTINSISPNPSLAVNKSPAGLLPSAFLISKPPK